MKFAGFALLSVIGGSQAALITSGHCAINTIQGSGLLCGKQGSWAGGNAYQLRQFPALPSNNQTFCMDACVSDFYCFAVAHDSQSKLCTTYSEVVRNEFFTASTTGVTYWNKKCIKRRGFCGVHNPSFEFGTRGTPQGSSYNGSTQQSAQLLPWSFGSLETSGYSFAKLIRNKHPPYGRNYLGLTVAKGDGALPYNAIADGMGQYITLIPGKNYTLYYSYRTVSYAANDNVAPTDWLVQATLGYNYLDTVPLNPLSDSKTGWQKRIIGFVAPRTQSDAKSPNVGTQFLQIAFGTTSAPETAMQTVYALDGILIARGTPSDPAAKMISLMAERPAKMLHAAPFFTSA